MTLIKRRKKFRSRSEKQVRRLLALEAMTFHLDESLKLRQTNLQQAKDSYLAAMKIGKRNRLHLPHHYRFLFCRSCYSPLSAETARIRLNSKKHQIHYQCLNCRQEHRFGYRISKKKR